MPDLNPYSTEVETSPTRVTLAANVRVRYRVVESQVNRLSRKQAVILDRTKDADRLDTAGMLAELDKAGVVALTDWLFQRRLPAEADAALKRLQAGKSEV